MEKKTYGLDDTRDFILRLIEKRSIVEKIDDDGFLTIKNRLSEKNGWRYARGSKNQNRA